MNRKAFIVVLLVLALLTINFSVAQEIDNSTSEDLSSAPDDEVLEISDVNNTTLKASNPVSTKLEVKSTTDFDVIGDYFKVKLSDVSGNALKNTKVTFTVSGKNYNQNTDSKGIASLQLRLNDGTYKITTKFAGNSNYKASSLTTTVKMTNTRVVDAGLSNSEIQKIIDNAKVNNVILFKGSSYSDVNLVITKCLTLQSNVNTVLKSSSGPVITIKGKSASLTTVKGFKIQSGGDGIVVSNSDYVKIINNEITGKGNGIVATGTKYLNITKNDIVKNSKTGIVLADSVSAYILNNKITNNGGDGIAVASSDGVYIHGNTIKSNSGNGIYLSTTVNGENYIKSPKNIYINKNILDYNKDGILIKKAGDNININSNEINSNNGNGISIGQIGNNKIRSNVITDNSDNGINFFDNYLRPKSQDISSNVIFYNRGGEIEAKDTGYGYGNDRLHIEDNWYSDANTLCPKIKTNNMKFVVKQTGENQFQATFYDSKGNIASLLPDRQLTVQVNGGKTITLTISGGVATFTTDANDGDLVEVTVDHSPRDNIYDGEVSSNSKPVNGQTPTYSYPTIPDYQLYDDIGSDRDSGIGNGGGNGNGDGTGEGSGGNANKGNGASTQESSSNTGNSTYSQKTDPANNAANQVNDVTQSYDTDVSTSQASASEASTGNSGNPGTESQSVVKQIIIDEDEFFRVTGMSFIVLLMILTVAFYYRDDIKEMNSKR